MTAISIRTAPPPPAHHWVAAAPFRAWLCQLSSDSGLPWRVLARASGVSSVTAYGLLAGRDGQPLRRIRQLDAERLLSLDLAELQQLAHERAGAQTMRRLLRALHHRGCSAHQIGNFIKLDAASVRNLLGDGVAWCSRLQQFQAEAACEAAGIDLDWLDRTRVRPRPTTELPAAS